MNLRPKRISEDSAIFPVGDGEFTVDFRTLSRLWSQARPQERPAVVDDFLRKLVKETPLTNKDSFEQVRDRLLVRVAQSNYASIPGVRPDVLPPKWDIVPGHLSVFLAVDEPDTVWTVGPQHLKAWGLTFEQAYDVGLENLRQRTDPRLQKTFAPYPAICYYQANDAHDASRMLLLGDLVQPWPSTGVVFGVPTREHLFWSVVNGKETLRALNYMLELNAKFLQVGAKPMTDQLFWFDGMSFQLIEVAWTEQGPQPGRPPPGLIRAIAAGP